MSQTKLGNYFSLNKKIERNSKLVDLDKRGGKLQQLTSTPSIQQQTNEQSNLQTNSITPKRKLKTNGDSDTDSNSKRLKISKVKSVNNNNNNNNNNDSDELTTTPKSNQVEQQVRKKPIAARKLQYTKELPTKATLTTLKEQLASSGKLQELRARLRKIDDCSEKLKSFYNQNKTAKLKVSQTSPQKHEEICESSALPANEKFSSLATVESHSLQLPYHYRVLAEVFRCVDTVVSMLHNRQELCTFSKLKPAVEKQMNKNFCINHLGQIKAVYPTAYTFSQEKIGPMRSDHNKNEYELCVRPSREKSNEESNCGNGDSNKTFQPLNSILLVKRRKIFKENLINIVRIYHDEFLKNEYSQINIKPENLVRWHPKFRLEEIKDIEAASLPELNNNMNQVSTAQDVLSKIQGIYGDKVDKALQNVSNMSKPILNTVSDSAKFNKNASMLKGISQSLLEKIRAKEAIKIQAQMMKSTEEENKQAMLSRLPEIVRILRSYFITEKKAAVLLETAVEKLQESYSCVLSAVDANDHIKMVNELAPDWLTVIQMKSNTYVKINKVLDINIIINRFEELQKKYSV